MRNLKSILEFTACCGFLFAVGPEGDLVLYAIAGVVFTIWSLRVSHDSLRWTLFNGLIALTSIFLGLACLEKAFLSAQTNYDLSIWWVIGGCALFVWTPLAGINGLLFLSRWLIYERAVPAESRVQRNGVM